MSSPLLQKECAVRQCTEKSDAKTDSDFRPDREERGFAF
jgi:hypothetical protein